MLTTDLDRGRTKTVLREDTGHSRAFIQQHHGEILTPHLTHTRAGHANANPCDGVQGRRVRRVEMNGHGRVGNEGCRCKPHNALTRLGRKKTSLSDGHVSQSGWPIMRDTR